VLQVAKDVAHKMLGVRNVGGELMLEPLQVGVQRAG
jgi:hypothetical protein